MLSSPIAASFPLSSEGWPYTLLIFRRKQNKLKENNSKYMSTWTDNKEKKKM